MPTVLREGGLRVVIYLNDHDPPHVHVFGDGETKVLIGHAETEAEVAHTTGATAAETRRALAVVREHDAYLLRRWSELHG